MGQGRLIVIDLQVTGVLEECHLSRIFDWDVDSSHSSEISEVLIEGFRVQDVQAQVSSLDFGCPLVYWLILEVSEMLSPEEPVCFSGDLLG